MRIIAGTARSLPLKTLPGSQTRPTTDRIKETLFNMIQFRIPGCTFLDLFSGSGGIALEAVSRGAFQAVLVDNSRKACDVIQENIDFTKFNEQCSLLRMDALAALRTMEGKYVFDIIFMDPPYEQGLETEAMEYLKTSSVLNEDTQIIIETSLEQDISEYEMNGVFTIIKDKRYKTNRHVFLNRVQENE